MIHLTRTQNDSFTQSVYGPFLKTNWNDHQFYLCVTGRSGFKLADILKRIDDRQFVFVDIGANIGVYSLVADKNPNCTRVYSIEPNPEVMAQLKENVNRNLAHKVAPLNCAIAENNGKRKFYFKDWHKGLGNFLEKGDHCIDVQVRDYSLLDEILAENPNASFFLKIDVEGFEPEIIKQLVRSRLKDVIDQVFIEISPMWVSQENIDFIFESLRSIGLKEVWRSSRKDQYDVHFLRPKEYKLVELERTKLGSWQNGDPSAPRYSICVCNYNMADTLERAMTSVIEQVDERFEVLVIDDGSSDGSVDILRKLADRYANFRYLAFPRDPQRKLGEVRNISIRAARGEYVLLHIDADDVWDPFLQDLIAVFHKVETAVGQDILFVGPQTGIGKRDFLLKFGPYNNIYRCEDRYMMFRLAARNRLIFLDYMPFRTRLKRPESIHYFKALKDIWSHTLYDVRLDKPRKEYILAALFGPFLPKQFTLRLTVLRALIVLPAYAASRFMPSIPIIMKWDEFMKYRQIHRGTFTETMARYGQSEDLSFLSPEAKAIFTYSSKGEGLHVPNCEKVALVCMVKDSYEYLSEFILYHGLLVDHIYLIDHNSQKDLRNLSLTSVTAVRCNCVAQFQSEVTNKLIEHFNIPTNFDWLFVLDIDEFLPFSNREEFQTYLKSKNRAFILRFFWRNGVPFYNDPTIHRSLIDCSDIRFFAKESIKTICGVHLKKVGANFVVPTGAHHIQNKTLSLRTVLQKIKRKPMIPTIPAGIPIFHILAFSKDHFVKKISNYVKQMDYRRHVVGQGGWVVQEYPTSFNDNNDEWLWYIANFRVTDSSLHCPAPKEEFERISIFSHLDRDACYTLRNKIENLEDTHPTSQSEAEIAYISQKQDDAAIVKNIEWFCIDENNEIFCTIPNKSSSSKVVV